MRVVNKRGHTAKHSLKHGIRGQVWVETVVYTLIAFIMIGLVLGVAKPKIEKLFRWSICGQNRWSYNV